MGIGYGVVEKRLYFGRCKWIWSRNRFPDARARFNRGGQRRRHPSAKRSCEIFLNRQAVEYVLAIVRMCIRFDNRAIRREATLHGACSN